MFVYRHFCCKVWSLSELAARTCCFCSKQSFNQYLFVLYAGWFWVVCVYLLIIYCSWKENGPLSQVDPSKLPSRKKWEKIVMGKPCHADHNKTSGLTLLKTVQLHTFAIFGTSNLFSHKCWKYLRFASQNIAGHGDEEVVLEKSNIIGVDVWYIFQVVCFFEFANMPSMNCWDAFRASLDVMSWPSFFVCFCFLFTNLRALASPSCSSNSSTSRTCALMKFEKWYTPWS